MPEMSFRGLGRYPGYKDKGEHKVPLLPLHLYRSDKNLRQVQKQQLDTFKGDREKGGVISRINVFR